MALTIRVTNAGTGDKLYVYTAGIGPADDVLTWYSVDDFSGPIVWTVGPTIIGNNVAPITGLTAGLYYIVLAAEGGAGGLATPPFVTARAVPIPVVPYYDITLVKDAVTAYVVGRTNGFRMKITATDPKNITDKIFLWETIDWGSQPVETKEQFVAVCKPGDLEEYPENAPSEGVPTTYFRRNYVDLVDRNVELLEETWQTLKGEVSELLWTLNRLRYLEREEVYYAYAGSSSLAP